MALRAAGQSALVEHDAQPGALRQVEVAVAKLAFAGGDGVREEALSRESMGEAGVGAVLAQDLRRVGGRGDADRTVERARKVGGNDPCDLTCRAGSADLGELRGGVGA